MGKGGRLRIWEFGEWTPPGLSSWAEVHRGESQVTVAVWGPARYDGGAERALGLAMRANTNTSPRSPIYYFSSAKRRQFLDLDFFWWAVTMVIELEILSLTTLLLNHLLNYLHTMTRRPPELCASPLYQEESWSQPSLGFFATEKSRFLPAWALPGRDEIPGFLTVPPAEGTHEKTKSKTRKE